MNVKYDRLYHQTLGAPKYVMAPMVAGSELPFRMMGRKYGCDLCYSPMVSALSIIETFKKCGNLDERLLFHELDRPLIVQLCGNDADIFVAAVRIIEGLLNVLSLKLNCANVVGLGMAAVQIIEDCVILKIVDG